MGKIKSHDLLETAGGLADQSIDRITLDAEKSIWQIDYKIGKTWLDECAMRAMQSVLIADKGELFEMSDDKGIAPSEAVAKIAYSFAQAMLLEKRRLEDIEVAP